MKIEHMEYIENKVSEMLNYWSMNGEFYLAEIRNVALGDSIVFGNALIHPKLAKVVIDDFYNSEDVEASATDIGEKIIGRIKKDILERIEMSTVNMKIKDFKNYVKVVLGEDCLVKKDSSSDSWVLLFNYEIASFPSM